MNTDKTTNNITRLELAPAESDPAGLWLEKLLRESKCWMTAGDIMQTTKGRVIDRDIRQLASDSRRIIGGQKGYKHILHATAEEVNRWANSLESRARKLSERAIGIRREAHKIFG